MGGKYVIGNSWLRNLVRMGSIGIAWEYLIQYGNTKTGMVTKFPIRIRSSLTKYCSSSLSKQCSGQIMSTRSTRVPHDAKCYIYKVVTCKGTYIQNGATKRAKFKTWRVLYSTHMGYTTVLRKGKHANILSWYVVRTNTVRKRGL